MPAAKPTPAFISRAIKAVRDTGETLTAVEVRPDGTVRVLVANAAEPALPSPATDSEEAEGKWAARFAGRA